jgi:hypothetical protein
MPTTIPRIITASSSNDDGLTPFAFDDTLPVAEENTESPFDSDVFAITNMATTNNTSSSVHNQKEAAEFHDTNENKMPTTPTKAPTAATETTMHVDAAENVYDAAKDVWAWGKGVFFMKPFLGLAEGVAGKVVGMAGISSLEDLDHAIMPKLQEFDDGHLNPAIQAMVGHIMGAVQKSEEIFKPVVCAILRPMGLIKQDESSTKKSSTDPELTPMLPATP